MNTNTNMRPTRVVARLARPSAEIAALAADHGNHPEALIPVPQAVQARQGGLTRAAIIGEARALGIPIERACGVAAFNSLFDVPPRPGNVSRVCDGPACWLKGAARVHHELSDVLGGTWPIERNSCLGLRDPPRLRWSTAPSVAPERVDNGAGLGASHQTGWTGVIARIMHLSANPESARGAGKKTTARKASK